MSTKLWFLIHHSLKKKLKNKWFIIANVLLLVLVVGIINIDSIISFFGGEFNETQEVYVIDETNELYPYFETNLNNTTSLLGMEKETKIERLEKTEEEAIETIKDSSKIIVLLEVDPENYLSAKVTSNQYIDSVFYQMIVQALSETKQQIALERTDIDIEEMNRIMSPINIERVILDEQKNTQEENMSIIMGTVFPTIILPFFILVIFLIQMIGAEINEEKSSRSMEIIISNVSPKTHFFSKIIASNLFVIIQGILVFLYGALGLFLRSFQGNSSFTVVSDTIGELWNSVVSSGFADKLGYIIPLAIILMLLSFLAYSLVAGILASMTVSLEDYQQIQTPILLICLVGYYLAIMAGMFEGSTFIKILGFVPFLSCLLAPALLILGDMTILEVMIAIGILALFDGFVIKYGLKIYKIGILNYSTDKMWQKIMKAARTKE